MALQAASGFTSDLVVADEAQFTTILDKIPSKSELENQLFFSGPVLNKWHDQMKKTVPPSTLAQFIMTTVGKDISPYWGDRNEKATAAPGEILKTLMTAKERLQKHGWAKTWQSDSGEICAGTAIGVGPVGEMRQPHGEAAMNEFCKAIGTTDFVRWNDASGREFKDVMRALDRTIEATQKQLAESA